MMLGTGATCGTLTAAICITPFRAWRDGAAFPVRPVFNERPQPCAHWTMRQPTLMYSGGLLLRS
jgi:hypothetical protein